MGPAPLGLLPQWDWATVISLTAQIALINHGHDDGIWTAIAMSGILHCQ